MMYSKAKLFNDEENAQKILLATKPGKMKALGRQVQGFNDDTWKQYRENILFEGILAKFTQNETLKEQLRGTYPKQLVEASPFDRVYGVGLAMNDTQIEDPTKWLGKNLLGKILERVREEIMKNF